MKRALRPIRNERGVAIPLILMTFTAVAAMTAYMLDTSRISITANEVQAAADIAATAGVRAQFTRPQGIPLEEARRSLTANTVDDGKPFTNSNLISFEMGNFNADGEFSPNSEPYNAARAVVQTQVQSLLMGNFGSGNETSTVTKAAIARFNPLGAARPTMPIVVGDCAFEEDCFEDSCMPVLSQVPDNKDNSAFTTFFDHSASTSSLIDYLPDIPCIGGGGETDLIKVGDYIHLLNGQSAAFLQKLEIAVEVCNHREFLIPIVPCAGQYNQTKEVLGFATIIVTQVKATGSKKGLYLRGIYRDIPGPPGGDGDFFGTGTISLVQ
ncbi:MAG TPA: hypothetical protein VEB21_18380 [Terriglobales bacterium]|nr:hypothetical protein [Terriglobales bacterium]